MPILDIQLGLRRVGKLRMGEQVEAKNRKGETVSRPAKLDTWRITSPDEQVIRQVAAAYGGEVRQWDNDGSPEFEVVTEASTLDVLLPPGDDSFSQWNELWSGGGCQRRCDGFVEQLSGEACKCPADREQRAELAGKGGACKATTRMSVVLPKVPALGAWMVESHGYYAAKELGSTFELLSLAGARRGLLPARLRIEQRVSKRPGEATKRYGVPVLDIARSFEDLLELAPPAGVDPVTGEIGSGGQPALPAAEPVTSTKQAQQRLVDQAQTVKGNDPVSAAEVKAMNGRVRALESAQQELVATMLGAVGLGLSTSSSREQWNRVAGIVGEVEGKQAALWEDRRKAVHAALGELGMDEAARHAFILASTGTTESTKTLSQDEANAVLDAVEKREEADLGAAS